MAAAAIRAIIGAASPPSELGASGAPHNLPVPPHSPAAIGTARLAPVETRPTDVRIALVTGGTGEIQFGLGGSR